LTAVALSTLQAVEHCSVGALPIPPMNVAPVLFNVSEPAAIFWPLAT
jgi:hypothetical protein